MKRSLVIVSVGLLSLLGLVAIGFVIWSAGSDGPDISEEDLQTLDEYFMGRPALLQEVATWSCECVVERTDGMEGDVPHCDEEAQFLKV